MFGCQKPADESRTNSVPNEVSTTHESQSNSSWYKTLALTGAIALSPHAICALGLGGLISVGGFSIHQLCLHRESEADSSRGIEIRRMEKVFTDYEKFPELRSAIAREALIAAEPKFAEVIEAKRIEAEGKAIEVVFLENENEIQVVICKEGALCPCSKPQAYDMGSRDDIAGQEKFRGQHTVLKALYGELDEICAPPGF